MNKNNAVITNIQKFCINDGPGTRTTVFFKGCPLRCFWCHNPETHVKNQELMFYPNKCINCGECVKICPNSKNGKTALFTDSCSKCMKCVEACYAEAIVCSGKYVSVEEIAKELLEDIDIYKQSGGGVTFSGGEPLLYHSFIQNVSGILKEKGIHIAVETSLYAEKSVVESLLPYVDLWICDIKLIDIEKHFLHTGVSNETILENIRFLSEKNVKMLIRTPIIPTVNDNDSELLKISEFLDNLPNRLDFELLAFHGLCVNKYTALNREYKATDLKTPTQEKMKYYNSLFNK